MLPTARALGESIFTQAEDLENLKETIRDAVNCHFRKKQLALQNSKKNSCSIN